MPIDMPAVVDGPLEGRDVDVSLNYLANIPLYDHVKPVQAVPGFLDKGHKSNIKLEQGPLETIHDIRKLPDGIQSFNLDRNAFQYVRHETTFQDWSKQDALRDIYLPQIEDLIHEHIPGADEIHIADVRLRFNNKVGTKNADGLHKNPYARQVHVDDTATSLTPKFHGVEDMRAGWFDRVRVINIWRPIKHPVHDCALAVCDSTSLVSEDVIECDRIFLNNGAYHDTMGVVKHRPGYQWYYLSEQTPSEVVMFTQYDSYVVKNQRPAPGCALHTAFDVPGPIPPGALPRESVEVRAFVFTYPTKECKIRPPLPADRLLSSTVAAALPMTGSQTQHQPITPGPGLPAKKRADSGQSSPQRSLSPSPLKTPTQEERFLEDLRLHEIILLRKQVQQLTEVNRKLKQGLERREEAERGEEPSPGAVERAMRMLMTAVCTDREYSWDAAEMWRKECGEQQVRMGYLPAMTDKQMEQLAGCGPYLQQ